MDRSPTRAARATLLALLGVAYATPLLAQVEAPAPLEIFYGFTLIDGRGGPPLEDAALAVRGNEIVAVSSRRELLSGPNAPRNAVPVNLGGGYVIPGLIDAHVHLATSPDRVRSEAELHRALYAGVTAVRDMAGDARALASLARDSRLGRIDAPDVYFAALMAGPSFFRDSRPQSSAAGEHAGEVPWLQAITPETDLRTAVAMARGTSATGVKIYANLDASLVRGITEEAHRQGMKVWAHSMVFPARPLAVVEAGVDVVSHVCRLAWEAMASAPNEYHHGQTPSFGNFTADSPVFTELFTAMRERGTLLDATLSIYARADSLRSSETERVNMEGCDTDFARALVKRAFEDGVGIVAGTDFSTSPSDPFPALHRELEELVGSGGLTPMGAIEAATRLAAEAIGVEDRLGTLQHGRPVTFVHLAENPLEDIANLRTVRGVWKNAVRFDRSAYRPLLTDEEAPDFDASPQGASSPREAFDEWLALWRRYDLGLLDRIYVQDATLTYYAADGRGAIRGYADVFEHHRENGFVPGGFRPEREVWIDDAVISDFEESAVVTGIWNRGNRVSGQADARGPFTLVIVRTANGYKVSHVHLGR